MLRTITVQDPDAQAFVKKLKMGAYSGIRQITV